MKLVDLQIGDEVGVFFYDDWRGSKATVETVSHISSTGTITVSSGVRYTYQGREVGALGDASYLCSLEKAQEIIDKGSLRTDRDFPTVDPEEIKERKYNKVSQQAAKNAIRVLNQYGWYSDLDGKLDQVESQIADMIKAYLDDLN